MCRLYYSRDRFSLHLSMPNDNQIAGQVQGP